MEKCASSSCQLCFCQRSANLIFQTGSSDKRKQNKKTSRLHHFFQSFQHIVIITTFLSLLSLLSNPLFCLVLKHTERLYSYLISLHYICWKRKKKMFLSLSPLSPLPLSIWYFLFSQTWDDRFGLMGTCNDPVGKHVCRCVLFKIRTFSCSLKKKTKPRL